MYPKGAHGTQEQELQVFASALDVGAGNRTQTSGRAVSTLNC